MRGECRSGMRHTVRSSTVHSSVRLLPPGGTEVRRPRESGRRFPATAESDRASSVETSRSTPPYGSVWIDGASAPPVVRADRLRDVTAAVDVIGDPPIRGTMNHRRKLVPLCALLVAAACGDRLIHLETDEPTNPRSAEYSEAEARLHPFRLESPLLHIDAMAVSAQRGPADQAMECLQGEASRSERRRPVEDPCWLS
jgi:hypothetical protein